MITVKLEYVAERALWYWRVEQYGELVQYGRGCKIDFTEAAKAAESFIAAHFGAL